MNNHLIIGDNSELVNLNKYNILKRIDHKDEDIISYDLETSTLSDILDEASTPSMFSDKKIIIGTNLELSKLTDNDIEYLNNYLKDINKNVYIILITDKVDSRLAVYKPFKNNFNIIDIKEDNKDTSLKSYIKELVKEKKYKISDYDIDYLLTKTGNDINNITNEMNKLFLYKDNKEINREDIDKLIPDSIDNIIYEFTNAILEDDTNKVTKMYHDFKIENVSFDYLISSIANSFRQSLIIKMLSNDNESNASIAKTIGKKEFYVKKMLERLYRYTENDLANYITKLANIDANFKSGNTSIDELELFLIDKDNYNVED